MDNRENIVCDLHSGFHETMNRIENKLDDITKRQIDYMERQIKIESIVTNGLSHNVAVIRQQLDSFCIEAGKRLSVLESFSWFRTWMNQLRDNLIKYVLLLALVGGVLFTVLYHNGDIIKALLK